MPAGIVREGTRQMKISTTISESGEREIIVRMRGNEYRETFKHAGAASSEIGQAAHSIVNKLPVVEEGLFTALVNKMERALVRGRTVDINTAGDIQTMLSNELAGWGELERIQERIRERYCDELSYSVHQVNDLITDGLAEALETRERERSFSAQ